MNVDPVDGDAHLFPRMIIQIRYPYNAADQHEAIFLDPEDAIVEVEDEDEDETRSSSDSSSSDPPASTAQLPDWHTVANRLGLNQAGTRPYLIPFDRIVPYKYNIFFALEMDLLPHSPSDFSHLGKSVTMPIHSQHTYMGLSGQDRLSLHSHRSNLIIGSCSQRIVLRQVLMVSLPIETRNLLGNQLTTLISYPRSRSDTKT